VSDRPVWECESCHKPLSGDDGVVAVSYDDIRKNEEACAEWDARNPGPVHDVGAEGPYPARAHWRVLHDDCGAAQILNPYEITSGRIGTWRAVASWSAHLLGKRWLAHTDWSALLYRAGCGGTSGQVR
jgi:hypothetical protein